MKILACITTRDGAPDWNVHERLARACAFAADRGIAIATCIAADNYSVAIARNRAVAALLQSDCTHLFFLDNDVHIQEDCLYVLAQMQADIAVGCYPSFKTPVGSLHLNKPYITVKVNEQWMLRWWDGVIECDGAGTGCMLIRRDVLEEVGYPWFVWREWFEDGDVKRKSDDIDFCDRAREKGYKILAHGNVRCGHIKKCDAASFIWPDKELDIQWTGPLSLSRQEHWPEYGSHVPVLQALLQTYKPRKVVEYGCGRFSTPTFLDSDIEELVSYESSIQWVQDTQRRNPDERLRMELCPIEQMAQNVHHDADLVMVDCDVVHQTDGPHDYSARKSIICAYQNNGAIVVVHDYEFSDIKPVVDAAPFKYRQIWAPTHGTKTAILSNVFDVSQLEIVETKRKSLSSPPPSPEPMDCDAIGSTLTNGA